MYVTCIVCFCTLNAMVWHDFFVEVVSYTLDRLSRERKSFTVAMPLTFYYLCLVCWCVLFYEHKTGNGEEKQATGLL